ncbi:MAG: hypothetical protein OHK003_03700 [Anaerolineales bacterium]
MALPLLVTINVASPAFELHMPLTERLAKGGVEQADISTNATREASSGEDRE